MSTTRWDELRVWAYVAPSLRALERLDYLGALFRWRAGEDHPYVWFMRGPQEIGDPTEVDWAAFPEERAREAAAGWRL